MTKDDKEIKKQPEEKKPQVKSGTKSSCGCGCIPPPIKTKQANHYQARMGVDLVQNNLPPV